MLLYLTKNVPHYGGTNLLPFDIFYELFKIMSHLNASYLQRFFSLSLIFSGTFNCSSCCKKYKGIHHMITIFPYVDWNLFPCFLKTFLWSPLVSWSELGWLPSRYAASYLLGLLFLAPFLSFYTFLEAVSFSYPLFICQRTSSGNFHERSKENTMLFLCLIVPAPE